MQKNKILEKLLAIILIFTLTYSNFAVVTKAYASSIVDTLFGSNSGTGHENVEFEAYFETEDGNSPSVISDVNNKELAISMDLDVKESGYLKDAVVEIAEAEEGKKMNFKLGDTENINEYLEGIEDSKVYFQLINNSLENINFKLPIEFKNESYMNEEDFSKDFKVKFQGIYVDEKGNEIEVAKEQTLNVSWTDTRTINVESQVVKYIDFGAGVILQTLVKVNDQTEDNTLPVKETELTVSAPTIDGVAPSSVAVVANSTQATNGKGVGDTIFNEENWYYNQAENQISIKVENQKQLVVVNEFEDEYLQDAEREVVEEERFYNGTGTDEYVVTYTYNNLKISEETTVVSNEAEVKMTTFSGSVMNGNVDIISVNNTFDYSLDGKIGEIVSLNKNNETEEVSKAYTYVNYDMANRYETEIKSETLVNISYKDIVKGLNVENTVNYYVDRDGNMVATDDVYYKSVSISKENFINILGEEGKITINDINGNVVVVIDNDSYVSEDGMINVGFEAKYSRLSFEISAPIAEGNLVISSVKALGNSSLSREEFQGITRVGSEEVLRADYAYVEGRVDIDADHIETVLNDTTTKATLVMDRDSLSTLAVNEDVELRVELNNQREESDVYGHTVLEFDLPQYIESFDVTNINMLYAEGLELSNVEVIDRTVRITIDGAQEGINSGVLTNGTNIVFNANIKVNLFTPAKSEIIPLRVVNDKATNYENNGQSELEVYYSAPTGLVAVNSVSNYNEVGAVLTSVRQGIQEDILDIYSSEKTATMEVIVMNNNANTVSELSILGRIPFAGVKDIATGEELGTTVDTTLASQIMADERNSTEFDVYYSSNGEATKDLNDESNGWTKDIDLATAKSYLIVPQDSSYEMQESEILRFTYQYVIPENLAHNEKIAGTFLAYYTNNSEIATTKEQAAPDTVELKTGEGPEVDVTVSTEKTEVQEKEELVANFEVANIGNQKVEEIVVTVPTPRFTTFDTVVTENDNTSYEVEGNNIIVRIPSLELNEKTNFKVVFIASNLPTIASYYKDTDGFMKRPDGQYVIRTYSKEVVETDEVMEGEPEEVTYTDEVINSLPDVMINVKAQVTAKDLNATKDSNEVLVKLEEAEFSLREYSRDDALLTGTQSVGQEYNLGLTITNVSNDTLNNVVVTKVVPEEFDFVTATINDSTDGITYDASSRTLTCVIDSIEKGKYVNLAYTIKAARLNEGLNEAIVDVYAVVKADGTKEYTSNALRLSIGKPEITITQNTLTTDTYIKEGDQVTYVFEIKNEGSVKAKGVSLKDEIPEGLIVRKISYIVDGVVVNKNISSNSEAVVDLEIGPNSETTVNVKAIAGTLNGATEKTVTNRAIIDGDNIEEKQTNEITHIIEQKEETIKRLEATTNVSTNSSSASTSGSKITKTYRVEGLAWEDTNSNGMRDYEESFLSGINVMLVNSETGMIVSSATTSSNGAYAFSNVENGNYLVIFDYDTVKYTVTTYQKEGVATNVNSDAVTTQIEQDGKQRNAAISDVITVTNGSVSGIDIGLVFAQSFDLSLGKTITKVIVQNTKTTKDEYKGTDLAKVEIAAKHLAGSTVTVEYAFTVVNHGDLAGYAKKIVDYIPEGMTFNSTYEVNKNWYTGSDGNLYNEELANVELQPGESRTIKLVLTKMMTTENTGIASNVAEIYEDYNIYGVSDKNSTPANKVQGENDLGIADLVIAVKTGEALVYVSVIITTIILGSIVVFIAYNKIVLSKKKGGV